MVKTLLSLSDIQNPITSVSFSATAKKISLSATRLAKLRNCCGA
jgi:hypothetical protein